MMLYSQIYIYGKLEVNPSLWKCANMKKHLSEDDSIYSLDYLPTLNVSFFLTSNLHQGIWISDVSSEFYLH